MSDTQTPTSYPKLMDVETYQATVDLLTNCHPEDLINILSRLSMNRGDRYNRFSVTVPGCPGESDCTDSYHTEGHLAVKDRAWTVGLTTDLGEEMANAADRTHDCADPCSVTCGLDRA